MAIATKSLAEDFSSVTFAFEDDTSIVAIIEDFPEEIQLHLAAHGLSQKGGDSWSGVAGDVEKAKTNLERVLNDLREGNWTTRQAGGGARTSQLVEALVRISGREVEEVQTVVESMTDDQKKALRASDEIKVMIAKIKLEKAEKAQADEPGGIDIAGLFAA